MVPSDFDGRERRARCRGDRAAFPIRRISAGVRNFDDRDRLIAENLIT